MTDDLRSLLHDSVSDVHPDNAMGAIRERTSSARPSASRWLPLTVAAAAAVVVVLGGTAWFARTTSGDSPAASGHRHTTGNAVAPARDLDVSVAYVGSTASGPRLFTEHHLVHDTTETALQAAVTQAFATAPTDPDYANHLRDLGVTATAAQNGNTITIDLSKAVPDRPQGMDEATATMVVQSLVWTADTATAAGYVPVTFTVGGQPTDQLLGVDTTGSVAPLSADSALAPVSIDSPGEGVRVPTTFEVRGQAATFEANVVWELKQGSRVIRHGFTTAAQCCTLSPYTFTVQAPPGEYTLVVHDTNESNGEGVGTSQDTKTIVVQ